MRKSEKTQIKQVLAILLSGVLCAGLFSAFMIYRYGPSGRYVAGNTILSPYVMKKVNYKDKHPATGKGVSFVFNGIEFSYFDNIEKRQHTWKLNPETYEKFYIRIAAQESLKDISESVKNQFSQSSATLIILMQTDEGSSQSATQVFQLIQFTDDDYFRVQLRKDADAGEWAYFYQPNIYQEVLRFFTY